MVQVFALQIELASVPLAHPLCEVQRRRPSHVVLQQCMILLLELFAFYNRQICLLQIPHTLVENLRHISATELPVKSFLVNLILVHIIIVFV